MNRNKGLCNVLVLVLASCAQTPVNTVTQSKVKNVIFIIGDGMGPQQVGLLLHYARQAPHSILPNRKTALDRLMLTGGRLGISMTNAADYLTTDSAASATQMATGQSALPEMIGFGNSGGRIENIVEKAKRLGKATGLVSDTRITHATPAAFAVHQAHRSQENEIAEELLAANSDVMLSGGLTFWIPKQTNEENSQIHHKLARLSDGVVGLRSKREDNKNLLEIARQQGYSIVFNNAQLQQANGKILGLFAESGMQNGIKERLNMVDPRHTQPTLREMSAKALDLLEQDERGFFLMIEAGQIDWAGHKNDTGLLLHEMLRFNETLDYVLDWAKQHQDTLIIVSSDHETGGFGFSYSASHIPEPIHLPNATETAKRYQPSFNYGDPTVLDKIYVQQRSYLDIFAEFDELPGSMQTPAQLAGLVNRYTAFKITEEQAQKVLGREKNPYYQAGHKTLGAPTAPKIDVNSAFFVYQNNNRENLLAQVVSEDQQVAWSTGTHTSTPVYVFVHGPESALQPFSKIMHHTELGRLAIDALENRFD